MSLIAPFKVLLNSGVPLLLSKLKLHTLQGERWGRCNLTSLSEELKRFCPSPNFCIKQIGNCHCVPSSRGKQHVVRKRVIKSMMSLACCARRATAVGGGLLTKWSLWSWLLMLQIRTSDQKAFPFPSKHLNYVLVMVRNLGVVY